ncbi:myo-inositol 2-dehydrogenase [Caldicoprobacter faecalis]|uniref:Myo-inositol 2-dehydrogenase n=1 Tax=Caldicoprobacter faecalis TaxID=937334 RepID=A0A1I5YIY4_9FIRM|nr:myo-inositol 2-dehydrogenase [Caldicoprobacter faecalis]
MNCLKLKIGIIGAGRIGRLHAENIATNIREVEVKSIADIYMNESLEKWAYSIGINHVYKDHRKIIEDREIDAVLICSPTDTHSKFIIEAAQAGKHIFCEKPIDFDVKRIEEALNAVEKAKVKLQIGFNRRFDHNFKRIKEHIENGKIGDVHILRITSRDPAPPPIEYVRVSGGIFLDMTIHDFDMARYLTGSEVVEVYAIGETLIDPSIKQYDDVDTAIVTLKFENGAIGTIDNSRKAVYGYDQRVEVFGSKGCLIVGNDKPSTVEIYSEDWVYSEKPKYFFLERYRESYIDEIRSFIDAILEDREPEVTGLDGLKPVLIGLAAKKSLETGMPVKVERV